MKKFAYSFLRPCHAYRMHSTRQAKAKARLSTTSIIPRGSIFQSLLLCDKKHLRQKNKKTPICLSVILIIAIINEFSMSKNIFFVIFNNFQRFDYRNRALVIHNVKIIPKVFTLPLFGSMLKMQKGKSHFSFRPLFSTSNTTKWRIIKEREVKKISFRCSFAVPGADDFCCRLCRRRKRTGTGPLSSMPLLCNRKKL